MECAGNYKSSSPSCSRADTKGLFVVLQDIERTYAVTLAAPAQLSTAILRRNRRRRGSGTSPSERRSAEGAAGVRRKDEAGEGSELADALTRSRLVGSAARPLAAVGGAAARRPLPTGGQQEARAGGIRTGRGRAIPVAGPSGGPRLVSGIAGLVMASAGSNNVTCTTEQPKSCATSSGMPSPLPSPHPLPRPLDPLIAERFRFLGGLCAHRVARPSPRRSGERGRAAGDDGRLAAEFFQASGGAFARGW